MAFIRNASPEESEVSVPHAWMRGLPSNGHLPQSMQSETWKQHNYECHPDMRRVCVCVCVPDCAPRSNPLGDEQEVQLTPALSTGKKGQPTIVPPPPTVTPTFTRQHKCHAT